MELRFDGRVAIVTGAGGGLGRAYAEGLAARGASVVVNDAGVALDGSGHDPMPAQEVVEAIIAKGGKAVSNTDRIGTESAAASLVAQTLEAFGRVDILINNAGNFMPARKLLETTMDSFDAVMRTHLYGSLSNIRAVWPLMAAQRYGKILNVGSHVGYVGTRNRLEYGTAKAALHGLTRCLSHESLDDGIFVNIIAPAALTRPVVASVDLPTEVEDAFSTDLVTPLALWLTHEDCHANGEAFAAMAGTFTQIRIGETEGVWNDAPSPEFIKGAFETICSAGEMSFPEDGEDRGGELIAKYLSNGPAHSQCT